MKKSLIFVVSALLLFALGLTGCSPKAEEAVETAKDTAVEKVATVEETANDAAEETIATVEEAPGEAVDAVKETVADAAAGSQPAFSKDNPITLKIGASPVPHAEILASIKDALAEKGINLEVVEFTDYVQPNTALEDGSLDANFFQHFPYLEDFNKTRTAEDPTWTELVPLVYTHFEPMAIYGGKTKSLADIKEGAKIAVPNDATNEARALLLLEANGLIKIAEGKGLEATAKDITENSRKIEVVELEAAQVARALADVDLAVVNGNYALDAGLTADDVLAQESADSEAANKYANLVAVRAGDENLPQFKVFVEVITSDTVKKFIEDTYKGAVAPVF
jgi:D-methionine transport system substrate-binding protein